MPTIRNETTKHFFDLINTRLNSISISDYWIIE